MQRKSLLFFIFLVSVGLFGNPFKIDFPIKENVTNEDYIEIQKKLKEIDISPILDQLYPSNPPKKFLRPWTSSLATKDDFYRRTSKALSQTLIDPEKNFFPCQELIKIGKGGDNCIVCYATFNGKYVDLIKNLPKELEKLGFNGYVFYRIGGFPNPSGKEIRYCGIPYCFKIFTMIEAHKMGFSKILWIDSAFLPLKDPTPLFDWIEKEGAFLKLHDSFSKFILPKTVEYIQDVTGVDVLKSRYVSAQILGFDFKKPKTKEFIDKYYELVELGLPFFSCFPEEYVFTAIIGQKPNQWKIQPYEYLTFPEIKLRGKTEKWVQNKGYFFLQKEH
ncbi:MAG: hypothetical protein JSS09_04545 [Verrucomicrobia bacterium]|nr:hypothetical protein [Verrucomicrobiota bacterium]